MAMFGGWTPIGGWRIKVNHSKTCSLCPLYVIETQSHAFYECPSVNRVWVIFSNLQEEFGLNVIMIRKQFSWGHWMLSLLFQWRKRDIGTLSLPFQSWIEDHGMFIDMRHEAFQLDVAILRALQITIHVGMATWEVIHRSNMGEAKKWPDKRRSLKCGQQDMCLPHTTPR